MRVVEERRESWRKGVEAEAKCQLVRVHWKVAGSHAWAGGAQGEPGRDRTAVRGAVY